MMMMMAGEVLEHLCLSWWLNWLNRRQKSKNNIPQNCYDREDGDDDKDVYDDDDDRNDNNCLIIVNTVNLVELVRHN